MKTNNYNEVLAVLGSPPAATQDPAMKIHKDQRRSDKPRLSVILLDWNCRERFVTLDWLARQNVPRDQYELIWIDLYGRCVPEVLEKADVVMTLNQSGMYHKHKGYNAGLLAAKGDLICVCDSDAVFPADWVESVIRSFWPEGTSREARPLVLMHHELRTSFLYPDGHEDAESFKDAARWKWWPVVPNAGACMTVRRSDAIRFGGFDEHEALRGYLCGPYELGWRLVNAGLPEIWHDESCVLWHFAHPDPVGANGFGPKLHLLKENTYPHVDMHAWLAVDAFSAGRFQPLQENRRIWELRMADRKIGTPFEEKYARLTDERGLPNWLAMRMKREQRRDIYLTVASSALRPLLSRSLRVLLGSKVYDKFRQALAERLRPGTFGTKLIGSHKGFNLVAHNGVVFGFPQVMGAIDPNDPVAVSHPAIPRAKSARGVKRQIDAADLISLIPVRESSYRGFEIVRAGNRFFAVRPEFDLHRLHDPAARERGGVVEAASASEIGNLIDGARVRAAD